MFGVRTGIESRNILLSLSIQNGRGVQPASSAIVTEAAGA